MYGPIGDGMREYQSYQLYSIIILAEPSYIYLFKPGEINKGTWPGIN